MNSRKLLKSLTAGRGSILVPHIEAYQYRGKFPPEWYIVIKNEKPRDDFFHPSGDCFTPPRQLWYEMKGKIIPKKIGPALRRTFDNGHMWHGYLENILLDMGLVKRENIERYTTCIVSGSHGQAVGAGTPDLIDVQIPGHGPWLVDIKTMNKIEFEQGASEYTMAKWSAQVSCYLDWMGTDRGMVLAVCKDSPHQFREYQIQKDKQLLQEIYDRWSYVTYCMRENIEPDDSGYVPPPELLVSGDTVSDAIIASKVKPELAL